MEQDEYAVFLRALTTLVMKLDERFDAQEELNRQQVTVNRHVSSVVSKHEQQRDAITPLLEEYDVFHSRQIAINNRLTAAIERIDVTLKALKDLLGRGNGA
jgi:hypothetical protein